MNQTEFPQSNCLKQKQDYLQTTCTQLIGCRLLPVCFVFVFVFYFSVCKVGLPTFSRQFFVLQSFRRRNMQHTNRSVNGISNRLRIHCASPLQCKSANDSINYYNFIIKILLVLHRTFQVSTSKTCHSHIQTLSQPAHFVFTRIQRYRSCVCRQAKKLSLSFLKIAAGKAQSADFKFSADSDSV